MKSFSFTIFLAMSIALLSCSNGPMLESGILGYEEEPYYIAPPPNTEISSDEVELYCKDMTFEDSIECVASLNDKKQEDLKTWQIKKNEQPKQIAQKKQTKKSKQTKKKK